MNLLQAILISLLALTTGSAPPSLQTCARCNDDICFQKNAVSIWSPTTGDCIFNGQLSTKDVFWTGHVFSLGVCPAVQLQIGDKCFQGMAGSIAVQLSNNATSAAKYDINAVCDIFPERTPCSYNAKKFEFKTVGYDCAEIKILADSVVEQCIRTDADARFWATVGYWIAVFLIPVCFIGLCCGCVKL